MTSALIYVLAFIGIAIIMFLDRTADYDAEKDEYRPKPLATWLTFAVIGWLAFVLGAQFALVASILCLILFPAVGLVPWRYAELWSKRLALAFLGFGLAAVVLSGRSTPVSKGDASAPVEVCEEYGRYAIEHCR